MSLLFDPLFLAPLLAGLLAAVTLGGLAPSNALHEEWLGAYALAQCAGAGVIIVLAWGGWPLLGAVGGAVTGILAKSLLPQGNRSYAYLWLGAWSLGLLVAAQTGGEVLAHDLLESQLYFATWAQVGSNGLLLVLALALGPWVMRHNLRQLLLPQRVTAPQAVIEVQLARLAQAGLLALGVAVGVTTFGVLATFGLLLLSAQQSLHTATSWRQAQGLGVIYAGGGYLLAYSVALTTDQPFTPVLLVVLLFGLASIRLYPPRGR